MLCQGLAASQELSPNLWENVLRPVGAAVEAAPLGVTEAVSAPLSFVRAERWRLLLTSHLIARSGQAQDLCFGHKWVLDTNLVDCARCLGVNQLID